MAFAVGMVCKLAERFDVSTLPKLEPGQIKMLWVVEWWDGPLAGVAKMGGERFYFHVNGPPNDFIYEALPRTFVFFRLGAAEWSHEDEVHQHFRENVGRHTDYGEDGNPVETGPDSSRTPERFYDRYKDAPLHPWILGAKPFAWAENAALRASYGGPRAPLRP